MKLARQSFGEPFECKMPWPDDCKVQCGGRGIVFGKKDIYHTAFFEAFPNNPKTFIRGEGATVEEAELACWNKLEKYRACNLDHRNSENFDRRDYTNGAAFCVACGLFRLSMFEPTTECCQCGAKTYYGTDNEGKYWCEKCSDSMPEELKPEWKKEAEALLPSVSKEEIVKALPEVLAALGATLGIGPGAKQGETNEKMEFLSLQAVEICLK